MNLEGVVTINPEVARQKYQEYRAAVRLSHKVEDELLARGYHALARGKRVVALMQMLAAGGLYEEGESAGFPRLAAVRADAEFCYVRGWGHGGAVYADDPGRTWGNAHHTRHRILVPQGTFSPAIAKADTHFRAVAPLIPPRYRPSTALGNYVLLWEATWERAPRAARDPALLRHLEGDLYIVLATWDLTDLERLVLNARAAKA